MKHKYVEKNNNIQGYPPPPPPPPALSNATNYNYPQNLGEPNMSLQNFMAMQTMENHNQSQERILSDEEKLNNALLVNISLGERSNVQNNAYPPPYVPPYMSQPFMIQQGVQQQGVAQPQQYDNQFQRGIQYTYQQQAMLSNYQHAMANGQQYAMTNNQQYAVLNDQQYTMPNDQQYAMSNDQQYAGPIPPYVEVRQLESITECKHLNTDKYLYISRPQLILSAIILIAYVFGVIAIVAAIIIVVVLLVLIIMAAAKGGGGGGGGNNCGNCDCQGLVCACNLCNCACNCLQVCCLPSQTYNLYPIGCDSRYYRHRRYRKQAYVDYEMRQNSSTSCDTCCATLGDCLCCSCCDMMSLGAPKEGCVISKVEVYCTECNSKLREEYQGTKQIFPALMLGFFGILLLVVSLLAFQKYQPQ